MSEGFDLKSILETYPRMIEEQEIELFKAKINLIDRETESDSYQKAVVLKVENEAKLEENKESLSNATKRSMEVKKRLGEMQNYIDICNSIDAEKKNIAIKEIKLNTMKRLFRAAEALVRYDK